MATLDDETREEAQRAQAHLDERRRQERESQDHSTGPEHVSSIASRVVQEAAVARTRAIGNVTSIRRKLDSLDYALAQVQNEVPNTTDRGNAIRMCKRYGASIHYTGADRWYYWDGARWNPDYEIRLLEMYDDVIKSIYIEVADENDREEKSRLFKHAIRSEGAGRFEAMLGFLRAEKALEQGICIPIEQTLLDADPFLFNVANGTLDLRTGELLPHRRENLITKCSPVKYDREAHSELWENFLDRVTGRDKGFKRDLQRAAGLSLLGHNQAEKFYYVLGPTASGKSTFVDAMLSCVGDYGTTCDIRTFLKHRYAALSPRDDLYRLMGVRQIVTSETPGGASFDTSLMKLATGGDCVTARPLYGRALTFRLGTIWIHANHAAGIPVDDDAMYRRLVVLPFQHSIPAEERDPTVKARLCNLKENGPAILTWRVEGCIQALQEGLHLSGIVQSATVRYQREQNPLHEWQEDRLEMSSPGRYELVSDMYDDYMTWCEENQIDRRAKLSKNRFSRALKALGIEQTMMKLGPGITARVWLGVRLTGGKSVTEDDKREALECITNAVAIETVTDASDNNDNDLPF